jgi:PTS system mannose-specific IIB component
MKLVLARIDDRLVHGQVVLGWIPHVRAQAVLVVSDAAAEDEMLTTLMRMALPEGVDLKVLGVQSAISFLGKESERDERRLLLLAPSPLEILRLIEGGVHIEEVNVGGLHYTAGRVQLGKAIFLSDDDRKALLGISRSGVKLEGKALPTDSSMDIVELISFQGERR